MAKASKRSPKRTSRKKAGTGSARPSAFKLALLLVLVVVLFGAAFYGLLAVDSSKRPESTGGAAPPVDHIDDSSREALREILREENAE